ncbi:MAG: hypothetical protein DRP85_07035, partial [Candidatus Makaraimicrobium thalassicum]
ADFAMVIHFHQPVGNFDHTVERACDKCYVPFLKTAKRYPEIKMSLHFTGCLLEWAEEKRPAILEMVREMVKAGQVEVISGGFYEPVLPAIPPADRVPQIRMLNEYIRGRLSFEPKGAWIAERIWEPSLPSVLYDAGIKYVILDDAHFIYSGIPKDKTYGYYITEDNAKPVAVFPSDKVLRYYIPYKMPGECMDYMRGVLRAGGKPLFIYGDDGEKFGEWPGTHKWVFQEKWLEKFFDELMRNAHWLSTVKLSDCLEKRPAEGRVYLPAASYEEMSEWALPVETRQQLEDAINDLRASGKEGLYKPFIRGGFWRNFLVKYPESNHMNKKMVYVSKKLEGLRGRGPEMLLAEARKDLFKGQCNCAYWHGVFGGLYLFHLRRAVYHHLIRSEVLMDKVRYGGRQFCEAAVLDMDADGFDEVILENRDVSLYFNPAAGGILKELDSKAVCHNLINSLARGKEAYHRKILEKIEQQGPGDPDEARSVHDDIKAVDSRIKDHMNYDWYGRYSLIDHFLAGGVDIRMFARSDYSEAGDFVKGVYDFEVRKSRGGVTLIMKREGMAGGSRVCLHKEITLPGRGACFKVRYRIINREEKAVDLIFGPEFNLTMPDADSDRYSLVLNGGGKRYGLNETIRHDGVDKAEVRDARKELSFGMILSEKCRLWHFPVNTVSQSEKAYELNYQSSAILPHLELKLDAAEEKRFAMEIRLNVRG